MWTADLKFWTSLICASSLDSLVLEKSQLLSFQTHHLSLHVWKSSYIRVNLLTHVLSISYPLFYISYAPFLCDSFWMFYLNIFSIFESFFSVLGSIKCKVKLTRWFARFNYCISIFRLWGSHSVQVIISTWIYQFKAHFVLPIFSIILCSIFVQTVLKSASFTKYIYNLQSPANVSWGKLLWFGLFRLKSNISVLVIKKKSPWNSLSPSRDPTSWKERTSEFCYP